MSASDSLLIKKEEEEKKKVVKRRVVKKVLKEEVLKEEKKEIVKEEKKRGEVYIASMNLRGARGVKLDPESLNLNVTSAQAKLSLDRRDFSPMTPIEGGYKGYWNFESRWQSGKIFEGLDEKVVKDWWKAQTEPKRRYPKGKGKRVLCARFEGYEDKGDMDYISSRKEVYCKEYYDLIKDRERVLYWKRMLDEGENITIFDFDGPRNEDKSVTCLKLTEDLIKEKINDLSVPFGHCYVVGMLLSGMDLSVLG
uniref:Uncharacterized protein n=1 Tax=viral metagenome TaxID=1070528 RepID=A0A6C0I9R7_9ZZZZ